MLHRIARLRAGLPFRGLSALKLGLGAISCGALSYVLSGTAGVLVTGALALAYMLGTASRLRPNSLRTLSQEETRDPVSREMLEVRIEACQETMTFPEDLLCIVLAIEDFDDITRKLGHRAGQATTELLMQRLIGGLRAQDMVAGLSPGRIAAVLGPVTDLDLERGLQAAMRLKTELARPIVVDGLRLRLTCAIGFCLSSRLADGGTGPSLLDAANHACDAALAQGGGSLRAFDTQMIQIAPPDKGILSPEALRNAIETGELAPWFQPQIASDTNQLTGVEALVRWNHPTLGVLAPGQFLDAIERAGLTARLSDLMLDRALAQLAEWDRAGLVVPRVSVNLGAADLADPTLPRRVSWALDKYAIAPARLGIEILETTIASADPDDITAKGVLDLGAMGCFIDMDDFGTGSASINGIRRFRIDRIKVDRSLVRDLDSDTDQHAMFAAILTMANQMNVDVLAEGVETPAEHSAVALLGCGHVQGFAIARPMPARDLAAWIARRPHSGRSTQDHNSLIQPASHQSQRGLNGKTA